jgi:hypothetical protein
MGFFVGENTMARYASVAMGWTALATADTTDIVDGNFHALQCASATMRVNIWEVKVGGLHTSALAAYTVLARHSTLSTGGLTGAKGGRIDGTTTDVASLPAHGTTATTVQPQRSSTLYLLDLGFNAFGGLVRLQLPPEGPIGIYSQTQPLGEASISNFTGGGSPVLSSHIIYEVV